jgi:hypothetical protein
MNQKTVDHFAAKTRRKIEINNLADWMSLLFFPRTGEAKGDFLWGWRKVTIRRKGTELGGPWVLKLVEEITCAHLGVH